MMPSRGLHLPVLRGQLHVRQAVTRRQLSSSSVSSSSFSSTRRQHASALRITRSFPRTWTPTTRLAIPSVAAYRFASTQTPTTPISDSISSSSSSGSPPPPSSFSNIDTITIDDASSAILAPDAIPEQLGYLHAIGIDHGWGPTSVIQWVLEHAHITLNLPWWGAIVLTAASLRLLLFPLYLKMSDSQARSAALGPVIKPLNEKMVEDFKNNNTAAAMHTRQQISAIQKRAGISTLAMFTPMVAQGILGFCGFRLLRELATLPVPGLKDGGFLWIPDLTLTDGYLLLPLFMAATMHVVFRLGGDSGSAAAIAPAMRKVMLYGMPGMIFIFTGWQPGAVALWFLGSGMVGVPQALLLQQPAVRNYFGLAPVYKPKPSESTNLFQEYMNSREKLSKFTSPPPLADGKNAAYMRPQYQSPNIRTAPAGGNVGRTIDAQLVDKSEMVQPSAPAKGIVEQAKEAYQASQKAETTKRKHGKK